MNDWLCSSGWWEHQPVEQAYRAGREQDGASAFFMLYEKKHRLSPLIFKKSYIFTTGRSPGRPHPYIHFKIQSVKKPFLPIVLLLCLLCNIARAQNCTTNAGLDQTICVTQPLVLTGTPGNPQSSPSAYLWTQVSGPAVTITTPTATSTTVTGYTPGNYVFQFSNKCIDNLFAVNLVSVTVLPEPPQSIAGADVANCSNTPVPLSANAVSAPFTGTWTASPAGGTFSPNANAANATFTPPAGSNTYTLTWTISNGSCASSSSKLVKVVTPTSPVSAGSTITLSCNGSCATLNGSSPGVAPPQNGFWSQVSGPIRHRLPIPTCAIPQCATWYRAAMYSGGR